MFDDADIGLVLTTEASLATLTAWAADSGLADRVAFVATDAEPLGDPDDWQMPELTGDDDRLPAVHVGLDRASPRASWSRTPTCCTTSAVIAEALEVDDTAIGASAGCRTSTTWASSGCC